MLGRARSPQLGLRPGDAFGRQPVENRFGEAADHADAVPVGHPVDPDDQPAGGEAAEVVVALEQHDVRAGLRRGPGRRGARRSAADHQHVAAVIDRQVARRFAMRARAVARGEGTFARLEQVRGEDALLAAFDALGRRDGPAAPSAIPLALLSWIWYARSGA